MYPVALNLSHLPIFLVGKGAAYEKRKRQLEEAGARTFVPDIENAALVLVVGLSYEESEAIAQKARRLNKLVNVEDVNELCDFYYTAHIKRGDLLIAVSTGGASPTLAKRVRDRIAHLFDEKWVGYTQIIKEFRDGLRAQGKDMKQVAVESEAFLEEKGWLKP